MIETALFITAWVVLGMISASITTAYFYETYSDIYDEGEIVVPHLCAIMLITGPIGLIVSLINTAGAGNWKGFAVPFKPVTKP